MYHAAVSIDRPRAKGLPLLLDAVATLPKNEYELAVAGSPGRQFRPLGNVKYLGFVREMADLYRAVDLTVLPAIYEPFGLVVTESIACGTPVITAAEVGATDVISPTSGIVLDRLNIAALARRVPCAADEPASPSAANFVRDRGLELDAHIERLTHAAAEGPSRRMSA